MTPSVRGAAVAHLACPELVGRDPEIATLAQLVAATEAGGSVVALISGEAGLGKTALLNRLAEIARRSSLRFLRGRGERIEMPRAFGPFLDMLATIRDPGDTVLEVLRARPEARDLEVLRSAEERYRAHAAFARAITEFRGDRPLMLLVDDLHFSDEASLELFAYLTRRLRSGVMLVGAYRPEALPARPALRRALNEIPRDRIRELSLRPLTATDTGRALRLILGADFRSTRETRELLQAQSRGNPLFLEEMLRALARRGDLVSHDGRWQLAALHSVPLPSSVGDTVRERLAGLDDETHEVIVLAAIIGERFDFGLLRIASGADEDRVLEAVRAGVRTQLIVEDDRGEGEVFVFRHALVREAILHEPLIRELRALHRRVAEALQRDDSNELDFAAIAYHYEEAGDTEQAFVFHRRAADQAAERGAFSVGFGHYEKAWALAPEDDRLRADLSMQRARLSGGLGRRARTLAAVEDAARRYERIGDDRALAGSLLHLENLTRRHLIRPQSQAKELSDRVARLLEPFGDTPELAWHLAMNAWPLRVRGRFAEALHMGLRSIAVAQRCDAGWEEATGAWSVAQTYYAMHDLSEALTWYRKADALASRTPWTARMQLGIAVARELADLLRNLEGETDETRRLEARIRSLDAVYPGDQDLRRMDSLLYAGEWDEFLRMYDDWSAVEGAETIYSVHIGLHRAFIDVARNGPTALAEIRELHERLLRRREIGPEIVDINGKPVISSGLSLPISFLEYVAHAALVTGDHGYLLDALEIVAPLVADLHVTHTWLSILAIYAVLAANDAGDEDVALRWLGLASWPDLAAPLTWSEGVKITNLYLNAERRWREGDSAGAIDGLAAFVTRPPERNADPIRTLFVALRYCDLLVARGTLTDRERAAREFGEILAFYRKAGASWYVARLQERAQRLGITIAQESRAPTTGLTRREREVALLVAEGLTNRQIAERLSLSVRTAESHVETIRAKLGLRTRAQVAVWASDQFGATRPAVN